MKLKDYGATEKALNSEMARLAQVATCSIKRILSTKESENYQARRNDRQRAQKPRPSGQALFALEYDRRAGKIIAQFVEDNDEKISTGGRFRWVALLRVAIRRAESTTRPLSHLIISGANGLALMLDQNNKGN